MISTSSSSRCTACARTVFLLNSPNASYTPAYVLSGFFPFFTFTSPVTAPFAGVADLRVGQRLRRRGQRRRREQLLR
ncbi:hypothetical protein NUW54_g13329 [Trametes sanguinea]|uniref:Uncharacterized protein n=1 Tax=Trametes sanguinea TaxID=158606 RepID=A0ACC1MM84_9APHY|nr:hypothetical protein NUW54_g13329 [Trametes sanguinea]